MDEALLILAKGRAIADVEAVAQVRQRYGDRVLIVATDTPERLNELGDVVPTGVAAPAPGADFTTTETIGIDAWNARQAKDDSRRPGDGLNWDSEGYDAP